VNEFASGFLFLFFGIHERVGLLQEVLEIQTLHRTRWHDADAEREWITAPWAAVARIEFMLNAATNCLGAIFRHVSDEESKFVAAEPREDVGLATRVFENVGGLHEGVVSFLPNVSFMRLRPSRSTKAIRYGIPERFASLR